MECSCFFLKSLPKSVNDISFPLQKRGQTSPVQFCTLQVLLITEQTGRIDGSLSSATTLERLKDGEKGFVLKLHPGQKMQTNETVLCFFKQQGSAASYDTQQQSKSTLFSRQILFITYTLPVSIWLKTKWTK